MQPGRLTPIRSGWDSASISSPSTICVYYPASRWKGRELDAAEQLTERVLSITEQRRPVFEFLALLDRAQIWAARGQVRNALTTVGSARRVLTSAASPALLARADEQEALLRLSLGDTRSAAELASNLPAARRGVLLARVALAAGDDHGV
jgi:ATP/maltotriose-dependent transcriptional regulator MalT